MKKIYLILVLFVLLGCSSNRITKNDLMGLSNELIVAKTDLNNCSQTLTSTETKVVALEQKVANLSSAEGPSCPTCNTTVANETNHLQWLLDLKRCESRLESCHLSNESMEYGELLNDFLVCNNSLVDCEGKLENITDVIG